MWKHVCFKNKNKGYRVKPNCIIIISSSTSSSSIITIINNAIVRDTLNIKKKAIDRRVQHLFMSVCIRAHVLVRCEDIWAAYAHSYTPVRLCGGNTK